MELLVQALPGDVHRVGVRLHAQPLALVDVRIEGLGLVLRSLVDGEAVPHQTAEGILEKLYPPLQHVAHVLLADQVEDELVRREGAHHQLARRDLAAVGEADAGGGSVLDDRLLDLHVGEELASHLHQELMGGVR
ncbi:MAG: hypothetical protein GWN32_18055, partial [Gemmatimonadetes bacterium]|nr:hypothetical protein [Gemmatimonadota bacterium]